jgi:Cysteine rich repeat
MTFPRSGIWTTLRDFTAVFLACIIGAIALFALTQRAHAADLPPPAYQQPPAYDDGYYPPSRRAAFANCEPDVRRYCPNVLPGGGRILSCLAGNKDRLTYRCRDTLLRAWAYYRR